MLRQYAGFIDGIKGGTRISIEGYAYGNILQPVKMTVNGKSYDLLANNSNSYNSGCGCYVGVTAAGFGMGNARHGW